MKQIFAFIYETLHEKKQYTNQATKEELQRAQKQNKFIRVRSGGRLYAN